MTPSVESTLNFEAAQAALMATVTARERLRSKRLPHHITLLNTAQFALLWHLDLTSLLAELATGPRGWRRKLHARLLAVVLVEAIADLGTLLGKPLRDAAQALGADKIQMARLGMLRKRLATFDQAHGKRLRQIRVTVLAHRAHDAETQIAVMRQVSPEEISALGFETLGWTSELYDVLTELVGAEKRTSA